MTPSDDRLVEGTFISWEYNVFCCIPFSSMRLYIFHLLLLVIVYYVIIGHVLSHIMSHVLSHVRSQEKSNVMSQVKSHVKSPSCKSHS